LSDTPFGRSTTPHHLAAGIIDVSWPGAQRSKYVNSQRIRQNRALTTAAPSLDASESVVVTFLEISP